MPGKLLFFGETVVLHQYKFVVFDQLRYIWKYVRSLLSSVDFGQKLPKGPDETTSFDMDYYDLILPES